jgi:ABC-type bacteriocin/lantibiotic exporter with double-glycine peptidase domain
MDDLGEDVTVLIVAHRRTTLDGCDRVIQIGGEKQAAVAAA